MQNFPKKRLLAAVILVVSLPLFAAAQSVTFTKNLKVVGNLVVTGALAKGSGTFVIDHPLDPLNKLLFHSFVESPTVTNIYDGIGTFDAQGELLVQLPSYWSALNQTPAYQWTGISAGTPNVYVKQGIDETKQSFVLAGGTPGSKISWQVTGVRHDPYILAHPVVNEVPKTDKTIVPQGKCLWEPNCE